MFTSHVYFFIYLHHGRQCTAQPVTTLQGILDWLYIPLIVQAGSTSYKRAEVQEGRSSSFPLQYTMVRLKRKHFIDLKLA